MGIANRRIPVAASRTSNSGSRLACACCRISRIFAANTATENPPNLAPLPPPIKRFEALNSSESEGSLIGIAVCADRRKQLADSPPRAAAARKRPERLMRPKFLLDQITCDRRQTNRSCRTRTRPGAFVLDRVLLRASAGVGLHAALAADRAVKHRGLCPAPPAVAAQRVDAIPRFGNCPPLASGRGRSATDKCATGRP